jgi:hypothetical protein
MHSCLATFPVYVYPLRWEALAWRMSRRARRYKNTARRERRRKAKEARKEKEAVDGAEESSRRKRQIQALCCARVGRKRTVR